MAQDIELDSTYGTKYDLKIINDGVDLTATIVSIETPDKLTITTSSEFLEVSSNYSIHFNTSAPSPLCINTTYKVRVDSLNPTVVTLLQEDEDGIILDGTFTADSIIYFINKDLSLISDGAQVIQKVVQRINTIKGEWVLNTQEGLPWFNDLLSSNVSNNLTFREKRAIFEVYMKQLILDTEGVRGLISFKSEMDKRNRNITFNFSIETIYNNIEDGTLGFDIPFRQ